ncbi:MAG: hypothetical protein QM541_04745 [Flavobacterium sp.]|nr:hypothetical protein [Flavobacterium sp.]
MYKIQRILYILRANNNVAKHLLASISGQNNPHLSIILTDSGFYVQFYRFLTILPT